MRVEGVVEGIFKESFFTTNLDFAFGVVPLFFSSLEMRAARERLTSGRGHGRRGKQKTSSYRALCE